LEGFGVIKRFMSKFNNLKFFKKTNARTDRRYIKCDQKVIIGEFYYAEELKNKFLHSLDRREFCNTYYQKHGDKLLKGA
jgi:hypothetical protein